MQHLLIISMLVLKYSYQLRLQTCICKKILDFSNLHGFKNRNILDGSFSIKSVTYLFFQIRAQAVQLIA